MPRLTRKRVWRISAAQSAIVCRKFSAALRLCLTHLEFYVFQTGATSMGEDEFNELLDAARAARPTPEQREAQRRSFVYGNTRLENELITREMVDRAAESLLEENGR